MGLVALTQRARHVHAPAEDLTRQREGAPMTASELDLGNARQRDAGRGHDLGSVRPGGDDAVGVEAMGAPAVVVATPAKDGAIDAANAARGPLQVAARRAAVVEVRDPGQREVTGQEHL